MALPTWVYVALAVAALVVAVIIIVAVVAASTLTYGSAVNIYTIESDGTYQYLSASSGGGLSVVISADEASVFTLTAVSGTSSTGAITHSDNTLFSLAVGDSSFVSAVSAAGNCGASVSATPSSLYLQSPLYKQSSAAVTYGSPVMISPATAGVCAGRGLFLDSSYKLSYTSGNAGSSGVTWYFQKAPASR